LTARGRGREIANVLAPEIDAPAHSFKSSRRKAIGPTLQELMKTRAAVGQSCALQLRTDAPAGKHRTAGAWR